MERLHEPKGIVIHHSATRDTASVSFDAIKEYHVYKKHWDDIGYHFLIEQVGDKVEVFTGRGLQFMGAHTLGQNDKIGICVVGDYDKVEVSKEKWERLLSVVRGLLMMYPSMNWEDIAYHREYEDKTCPGSKFPSKATLLTDLYKEP